MTTAVSGSTIWSIRRQSLLAAVLFERLKDANIFPSVQIGPDSRALIWRIGKGETDVIVVSADELWLMKRSVDF